MTLPPTQAIGNEMQQKKSNSSPDRGWRAGHPYASLIAFAPSHDHAEL